MKNKSLYAPLFDESIQLITVTLDGVKAVAPVKCDFPVQVGDKILIEHYAGYGVGHVESLTVSLTVLEDEYKYRWAIMPLDFSKHEERLEAEDALINRIETARMNSVRMKLREALGLSEDTIKTITQETKND